MTCEYDGLRASGEAFSASFAAGGVQVEELLVPEVLHGHIHSPWPAQADRSYPDMARWVRTGHPHPSP